MRAGAGTASSDPRLAVIYDPVNGNLWLNNAGLGDHPAREFCRFPLSELMPPSLAGETRVTAVECAPVYDLGEIAAAGDAPLRAQNA